MKCEECLGEHTRNQDQLGASKDEDSSQMRGTNVDPMPGHLAEYWWKGIHKEKPFWDIITEIARQFPLVQ